MLPNRNEFLNNNLKEGLAICGVHGNHDSIHVGVFWNSEGENKIIHFINGLSIPVQDATDVDFERYLFCPVPDFPSQLLPSLAAIAELISQNKLNGFRFNRVGVVYDGGKFEYQSGAYTGKTPAEKFINCAVFVIALLNTFDYCLLEWQSWPDVQPYNKSFLDRWLDSQHIPVENRENYYNKTKEVRGRHVLISPLTETQPSIYREAEAKATELIQFLMAS